MFACCGGFLICIVACWGGPFLCMLNDEVSCLHVERNMLVGASYLDIEDSNKDCSLLKIVAVNSWLYIFCMIVELWCMPKCLNRSWFLTLLRMQAKALAEKNERDMNVQREQAERDVSTLSWYMSWFFFFWPLVNIT